MKYQLPFRKKLRVLDPNVANKIILSDLHQELDDIMKKTCQRI